MGSATGQVVAIFRDDVPAVGAASAPEALAGLVRRAGYEAKFLDAAMLADEKRLDAGKVWLVILPYGATFLAAARENFQRYLAAGGDFVSTGGYAFNNLVVKDSRRKWARAVDAPWQDVDIGGDFEGGTGKWQATGKILPEVRERQGRGGGRACLVQVAEDQGTAEFHLDLEPRAGYEYEFSGWMRQDITSSGSQLSWRRMRPLCGGFTSKRFRSQDVRLFRPRSAAMRLIGSRCRCGRERCSSSSTEASAAGGLQLEV